MKTTIQGKIESSKSKSSIALVIYVNVCIVITLITCIFSFINNGTNISNISSLIISILILFFFNRGVRDLDEHYEFCIIDVDMSNTALNLNFKPQQTQCHFDFSDIAVVEYNISLQSLTFVGKYTMKKRQKQKIYPEGSTFTLFLNAEENPDFLKELQKYIKINIFEGIPKAYKI